MKAENAQGTRPMEPVRPQQNNPQMHHTTTTSTSPAVTLDWIKFDFDYFKSIPGILKIVQFVSLQMVFHVCISSRGMRSDKCDIAISRRRFTIFHKFRPIQQFINSNFNSFSFKIRDQLRFFFPVSCSDNFFVDMISKTRFPCIRWIEYVAYVHLQ